MDDKRLILFFVISFAIMAVWYALVGPPPQGAPPGQGAPAAAEGRPAEPAAEPAEAAAAGADEVADAVSEGQPAAEAEPVEAEELPSVSAAAEEVVVVEGKGFRAELSNRGGQLLSYRLTEHEEDGGGALELVRHRTGRPYPLALLGEDLAPLAVGEALFAVDRQRDRGSEVVLFEYRGDLGAARKRMRFRGDGLIDLEVEVAGQERWGLLLGPGIRNPRPEAMKGRFRAHSVVYRQGDEVTSRQVGKVGERQVLAAAGLTWFGIEDTYFLTALVPQGGLAEVVLQPVGLRSTAVAGEGEEEGEAASAGPFEFVPFDDEDSVAEEIEELPRDVRLVAMVDGDALAATAFFGAKDYERLAELPWGLEQTVEWGWFGILARPLLAGLEWIHSRVVPNYGWAIVLMTIGLKLALFPLTNKSQESMLKMQKLQPQMQAIRQRWRGKLRDKQGRMNLEAQRKMNEEIQELFRAEGASPYGGCLPILLQIPVFFAFFRLLLTAVELRHEPWLLWIHDLSTPDPYYVLPLLMGASQIYQQKLTPMAADPMQRRIMQLFPYMFTVFALGFPSGLVLYWTVNNTLTIGQTALLNRKRARLEEAEAAAKAEAKRAKKKRKKGS